MNYFWNIISLETLVFLFSLLRLFDELLTKWLTIHNWRSRKTRLLDIKRQHSLSTKFGHSGHSEQLLSWCPLLWNQLHFLFMHLGRREMTELIVRMTKLNFEINQIKFGIFRLLYRLFKVQQIVLVVQTEHFYAWTLKLNTKFIWLDTVIKETLIPLFRSKQTHEFLQQQFIYQC